MVFYVAIIPNIPNKLRIFHLLGTLKFPSTPTAPECPAEIGRLLPRGKHVRLKDMACGERKNPCVSHTLSILPKPPKRFLLHKSNSRFSSCPLCFVLNHR